MRQKTWFEKTLDAIKDSFEYRLEGIILNLTEQICQRMKDKRLTRTQLAEKLQVSPAAVTKLLNGNSNFTLKTLLTIGDALDLDLGMEFRPKEISAQESLGVRTGTGNIQEGWTWTWNEQGVLTWTSDVQYGAVTTASTPVSLTPLASAESSGKIISFPERKQEQRAA